MTDRQNENPTQIADLEEFKNFIRRLHPNATIIGSPKKKQMIYVEREKGGSYRIYIDAKRLSEDNFDNIIAQTTSKIESLYAESALANDPSYKEAYELYQDRAGNPAYKIFYDVVFEMLALHRGAVSVPILREKLTQIAGKAMKSLHVGNDNVPLHIQFLLGLMGSTEHLSDEVLLALSELRSIGVIGFIQHIQNPIGEKLIRINDDLFPMYEYFLRKDMNQWRKKKEAVHKKKIDEIKEETREKIEEQTKQEVQKAKEEKGEDEDKPERKDEKQLEQKIQEDKKEKSQKEQAEEKQQQESDTAESDEPVVQPPQDSNAETEAENIDQQGQSQDSGQSSKGQKSKSKTSNFDDGTPDHHSRYSTPEDGNFEDDPEGKGYQLEIYPPLHGYYIVDRKSVFDPNKLEWDYPVSYKPYQNSQFQGEKYTLHGTLRGSGIKPLPIPNGYAFDVHSLQFTGKKPEIYRDQNGNFFAKIYGQTEINIDFYKEKTLFTSPPTAEDYNKIYTGNLSPKAEDALQKGQKAKTPKSKAEIIRDYIRAHHFYPKGKTSKERLQAAKETQLMIKKASTSANYIQNLDAAKYIECYSANTLMTAMMRELGVPCRVVTGHRVFEENEAGNSVITLSNAHGWCEIWDGSRWVRFDATPDAEPEKKEDKKEDEKDSKEDKKEDSDTKTDEEKKKDEKKKVQPKNADDGGVDTPPGRGDGGEKSGDEKDKDDNKSSENEDEDDDDKKSEKSQDESEDEESADDSSEKGDSEGKGDGESDGEKGGESSSEEGDSNSECEGDGSDEEGDQDSANSSGQGDASSSQAQKGGVGGSGNTEDAEYEESSNFDPEEEFKKMYDELQEHVSERASREEIEKALEQIQEEQLEIEQEEELDPIEEEIKEKFPHLTEEELQNAVNFVKYFLEECEKVKRLRNPNVDQDPEHPFLIDVIRSILDRVISRSIKEKRTPRFPVRDGEVLIDPVTRYFDRMAGIRDSDVWQKLNITRKEELHVVKLRKRKILDASGSMSGGKLDLQQQIEVLENIAIEEKQKELDDLSAELDRDLHLETQTWQFGACDIKTPQRGYRLLKALSSDFPQVEQAVTWQCAGQIGAYGTNDFDPLEAIYKELLDEHKKNKLQNPDQPTVIERIRAGFVIRELKNLEELEDRPIEELSKDERVYLKNLQSNKETFEKYIETITAQYPEKIEPIIEVIEVSTDGGSNDANRVQGIIKKLRDIGVIVIAYGLGYDGCAVETTYKNTYNPLEGGYPCVNLLDYPNRKADAWQRILDKI